MLTARVSILLAAFAAPALAQSGPEAAPVVPPGDDVIRMRDLLTLPGGPDGPGFDLNWNTVDGGGAMYLTGGTFQLGATAGQPDAGQMSGGSFTLGGGFWYGVQTTSCYANCDGSTGNPVLTPNDFQCFLNAYASNSLYANCDNSTGTPALTANDFQCFLNVYAAGCS